MREEKKRAIASEKGEVYKAPTVYPDYLDIFELNTRKHEELCDKGELYDCK